MPVSRPILIALGGALLALVAFVGSSAMRGGERASSPAPPPPSPAAPKAAKAAPGTPAGAKAKAASRNGAAKAAPSARSNAPKPAPKPAPARVTRSAPSAPTASKPRTDPGLPARVRRAFADGRTVVLFFYQRGGADDRATAAAVDALRGRRGIAVFTAPVSRLGDFRAVTGNLGLSQAPAVVIVGRKGKKRNARVVEGFVDPETLAQEVADSR